MQQRRRRRRRRRRLGTARHTILYRTSSRKNVSYSSTSWANELDAIQNEGAGDDDHRVVR
jgi:hypothetical protein